MPVNVRPWLSTPVGLDLSTGTTDESTHCSREVVVVSEKVICRIGKEDGIVVLYKRTKARYSSYKGEIAPSGPDLVKGNFHAEYRRPAVANG